MNWRRSQEKKVRCFISFDYDHDKFLKESLIGQSKNEDSPFEISDWSIKEENNDDWKKEARDRIKKSDVVIIICGKHTNTAVGVSVELSMAKEEGINYFLLAGYKDGGNCKPKKAESSDKMYKWEWDNLKNLIHGNR